MSTHLKLVGESYGKHLLFTLKLSSHLLLLSIVSIIHGLVPWIFSSQVSHGLKNIISTLELRTKIKE
jgi:hypothetical protein